MHRIRVLIADDNPLSLQFFADALATLDIESATAENGVEAAVRAEHSQFDLLLFDACMPMLDGIGALQRIRRSSGASRDALALATTASVAGEAHAALRAAGFADVLAKPLSLADLLAAVTRRLGDSPTPRAAADTAAPLLADAAALAAVGGDATIAAALRRLFLAELDALPGEIEQLARKEDRDGLRDRLHRLDASAGFCGTPTVQRAAANLRAALAGCGWPGIEIDALLGACENVRRALRE